MYCLYTGCVLLVQWQYVFTRLKYYLSVSIDYYKCKTNIQIKLSSISHNYAVGLCAYRVVAK